MFSLRFSGFQSNDILQISGVPVAKVEAFDPDQGLNSTLTYSIMGGNDRSSFEIQPETGKIKLSLIFTIF